MDGRFSTHDKSIAIIICYFGKLPWYFDYFAHSCKYNLSIDFFIITDDFTYSKRLPTNVNLIYKTLNEISELATEKLGFKIEIKNAYKLCDFKPIYGFLFGSIVKNYDFWGHGDIDVIYGNIRNFFTDEILSEYDLISVRPEYITGFLGLYRNNKYMNTLFKKSKDYKVI